VTLVASAPCAELPTTDLDQRSILHLGCGRKYNPDAVNVDRVRDVGPDFVVNLDESPWPFPDNRFREVRAYDVLEHLDDLVAVMEEIHRICQPEAVVRITVPHFSCSNAFADITHRHYFSASSFNYFTGDNEFDFYSNCRFRKQKANIVFYPTLMNKLVHRIANRWPVGYERRWAWFFPAWFLDFELVVVKGES
jgi:SAM-dependent methyltransferase